MRVAVIGSRSFPEETGKRWMRKVLAMMGPGIEIVSGGADGVDTWAANEAFIQGMDVRVIRPDYVTFSDNPRRAPIERNRTIVDMSDVVIAFWHDDSRGTKMAVEYARAQGKPVLVVTPA